MKYPALPGAPSYRVSFPPLDGGVNAHDAANQIEDNQLADVCNMWWADGALRTRPGITVDIDSVEEYYWEYYESALGGTYDVMVDGKPGRKFVEITRLYPPENSEWRYTSTLRSVTFDGESRRSVISTDWEWSRRFSFLVESGDSKWEGCAENGAIAFFGRSSENMENRVLAEPENPEDPWVDVRDKAYVPTVLISGVPSVEDDGNGSGGKAFEGFNLLSPEFKATYTSNGEGLYYFLPVNELDDVDTVIQYRSNDGTVSEMVIPAGETTSNFDGHNSCYAWINREKGCFWFSASDSVDAPLALPNANFSENIEIRSSKTVEGAEDVIFRMRFCTWYGGSAAGLRTGTRLFVSGNPDKPGLVHWSDVNKPLYFPENNYFYVGNSGMPVTAFAKQGEKLLIFKAHEIYCTTYNAGSFTAEDVNNERVVDVTANAAVFPLIPIHPSIGCDCPDTIQLCDNRLIWATGDGNVYGLVTTNAFSDIVVTLLSRNIEKWTGNIAREDLQKAQAFCWNGYYVLLCGDDAFCLNFMDSRFAYHMSYSQGSSSESKLKWYVWYYGENGRSIARVLSNGSRAVALCGNTYESEGSTYRFQYMASFAGEVDESIYYDQQAVPLRKQSEISCMFQTKALGLSAPEREKTIEQVYISASNRSTRRVNVVYLTEQGETMDAATFARRETRDVGSPAFMTTNRFTPALKRVQHFGLRIESMGAIVIGEIALKYKAFGRSAR